MPIVVAFFRDETYAKNSDLLDAAVEALGAVAMYLPWESYLSLLHFYLRALVKTDVNQKLVVRYRQYPSLIIRNLLFENSTICLSSYISTYKFIVS